MWQWKIKNIITWSSHWGRNKKIHIHEAMRGFYKAHDIRDAKWSFEITFQVVIKFIWEHGAIREL